MSLADLPRVTRELNTKDLSNVVAMIVKDLEFVINGRLDANNIRANSIETKNLKAGSVTADKILVSVLSAISANLGHINAGSMETVTMTASEIIGSLIMTALAGVYPRVEFSSSNDLIMAELDASNRIELIAQFIDSPALQFVTELITGRIFASDDIMGIFSGGTLQLNGIKIYLTTTGTGKVYVENWDTFAREDTNETLQEVIDDLQDQINDLDARVSALEGP